MAETEAVQYLCGGRNTRKENDVKVMVLVKATKNSEAGVMPSTEMLAAMGAYNEQLVKAGIMQAGEGLASSSRGKRVELSRGKKTVVDGPFAETRELVAGFWIWKVASMDEAMSWALRCPDPMPGEDSVLEIRPILGPEDFGDQLTPELRENEEKLRAESDRRQKRGA
jgi:hypothetical protein